MRGVVILDCPGRRRSSSAWISSFEILSLGGTPSITQPTPLPCDSPNVVTRKAVPQVLAAPARAGEGIGRRRWRCCCCLRAAKVGVKGNDDDEDFDVDGNAADVDGGLMVLFPLSEASVLIAFSDSRERTRGILLDVRWNESLTKTQFERFFFRDDFGSFAFFFSSTSTKIFVCVLF